MFKSLGNLIYRTPWWGLVGGGLIVLAALVMFTTPIHLLRLSDSGKTAAEKSAIKREISLAFGDRALNIAENVVSSMKERASDPDRIRELNRALAEMARARGELAKAQAGIAGSAFESARDAADSAIETAAAAAESALESATEAREAIEEARDEAAEKLRSKGVDTAAARSSFDGLLKSARESEATARESLTAIRELPRTVPPANTPEKAVLDPAAPHAPSKAAPPATPPPLTPPSTSASPSTPATPTLATPTLATPTTVSTTSPTQNQGTKAGPPTAADPAGVGRSDQLASSAPAVVRKPHQPGIVIQFDSASPNAILSAAVRDDIRAKVAGDVWRIGVGSALILLFIPLFIMLLIAKYFIGRSRRALAFAEEKKQEAKISDVSRQITEARLQALQAQVEPHFLYNTLANVQALTEFDPPAANAMVGHLIQYLRAALPKMRESTSTVGQEIELVRAYLNILKMRMGARLEFGIDVASELLTRPFPPMMLPSLVENAIKHGLEPLREGGRIDVVVTRIDTAGGERIRLEVRDTGKGLTDTPVASGGGIGLANLRERLTALYGDSARFAIQSNTPQGVIASIELPVAASADSAAAQAASSSQRPTALVAPPAPTTRWRRAWQATSKTHRVWAWILSRIFFVLMFVLAGAFILALIGLYTGWLPVDFGDIQLQGVEGMALGSVLLLAGFVASVIALAVVAAVVYGLGFVFAGLLILVPTAVLIFLFPVLAPFILIGLGIYWVWRRRRREGRPGDTV